MAGLKRKASVEVSLPNAKRYKSSKGTGKVTTFLGSTNSTPLPSHMGRRLPNEILDMIFTAALDIDTKPTIHFLEADFCRENKANQSLDPVFYVPTKEAGAEDVVDCSSYRSNLAVAQTNWGASEAYRKSTLCNRNKYGENVVEITAQVSRDDFIDVLDADPPTPLQGKTLSIQLCPSKDLLCLQAPIRPSGQTSNWFSTEDWHFTLPNIYFRPLWPQGIDQLERLAIDWKTELTRGSIRTRCCSNFPCKYLKDVYQQVMYCTPPSQRAYCSSCLGSLLDAMSASVESSQMLYHLVDGEFGSEAERCMPFGSSCQDEFDAAFASFECVSCQTQYPISEGLVSGQSSPWKPNCLNWHDPKVHSDIETLFRGRMRKLRSFYIICTDIKLKEGRLPAGQVEEFSGYRSRFVQVDEEDDCWDLTEVRGTTLQDRPGQKNDIDPFRYAEQLEEIAWASAWQFPRIYTARNKQIADEDKNIWVAGNGQSSAVSEEDVDMETGDAEEHGYGGYEDEEFGDEAFEYEGYVDDEDDTEDEHARRYYEARGMAIPPLQQWPMDSYIGRYGGLHAPSIHGIAGENKFSPVKVKILACIKEGGR
ncbi:hypothetical protein DL546_008010 [Coniochaeta pulveracea]|uniref:Uncharacterized protein n=1 Tax=Coniochaeta pulveracea TaxID=177199 RepID=A0A420YJP0_9PEZI|nr:hypothetical protein DL546_008010 [Coniochaeta pulveracea]